jgi:hypothetical protein
VTSNAYSAVTGSVDHASGSSTAIGNSHGYSALNGSVEARTTQPTRRRASLQPVGVLLHPGLGFVHGDRGEQQRDQRGREREAYHEVTQTAGGATRAVNSVEVVTGNNVAGAATASANLAHTSNTGDIAEIHADQYNGGTCRRRATSPGQLVRHGRRRSPTGVGNSVSLVNVVADPIMRTNQVNDGDVNTVAVFDGGAGEDVFTSATSIGNTVSGYACSTATA